MTTPDTEGVHAIANTDNPGRRADIVFVHGLGGASHATWRHGNESQPDHFFWPEELGKELADCGIWSVGYAAGKTHWFSDEGLAIDDRAANLALKLSAKSDANFGSRPMIFVTHSMGGLVVKEFVTGALSVGGQDWNRIADAVHGLVFLGTPHHGAHVASVAKGFSVLMRTQEHVKQMKFAAPALDKLHVAFVKWQSETNCLVETYRETRGIAREGWFGLKRLLPRVMVVPRLSADPVLSGCMCHPVPADHRTLVKPQNAESDVFAGTLLFLRKTLESLATSPSEPVDPLPQPPGGESTPGPDFPDSPGPDQHRRVDISRIIKYAPERLIGRESETELLADSWQKVVAHQVGRPHVLGFVALGGEGKTSLVAKWLAGMAGQDWPGCESVFAWSFYSQGSREQVAVSSDLFLAEALKFFGDPEMAGSAQGAYEKGQRLAELVGGQRSLLILDGVEPLQYPPSSPTGSRLKDQGMEALLKGLAASSNGLCIVTTRYSIPDLAAFAGSTWQEEELKRLSREAGVALLKDSGVKGSEFRPDPTPGNPDPLNEYEQLVEDVKGHALKLQILGQYLKWAHHGDIRRRDRVELAKADSKVHASHGFGTGHAFRAIAAYEAWLADNSEESQRELAVLRLFDRPATADCVQTLRQPPAIDGLTDPLVGLPDEDWEFTLTTLSAARLVSVNRSEGTGELFSLDAHPLIREYFAMQLRRPDQAQRRSGKDATKDPDAGASSLRSSIRPTETSEVWRAAHRRLYEHLCETTKEGDQPTLEDLQPLYQAVAHGCQAGLQQEACDDVYKMRIMRGDDYYSTFKLGSLGSDLGAIACFFELPWNRLSPALAETNQAWLLNEAGFTLRALGRLRESFEPMCAVLERDVAAKAWEEATRSASNLSELNQTLGRVIEAESNAERSVTYADRSDTDHGKFLQLFCRTTHADALHQSGRRSEAESLFREAEQMQAESQPAYPLLYSVQGFRYCDLLLAPAEREAWGRSPELSVQSPEQRPASLDTGLSTLDSCHAVTNRATQTLKWTEAAGKDILSASLDHLTLACASLYQTILGASELSHSASPI
jgi:hypothetical protein